MRTKNKKTKLLKTPLNDWHHDHGALLAPFGDYQLPLWYESGSRIEHLSVLKNAGLFDTCHMATISLEGPGAFARLQRCFSRDLTLVGKHGSLFSPGKGLYGVFLNPAGHLIDDAVIYQTGAKRYFICVNAGKGPKIAEHLFTSGEPNNCQITELSGELAKIDLQGPHSARILSSVLQEPQQVFESFPYFTCKGYFTEDSDYAVPVRLLSGTPLMLARSGYTGEFGFEIFVKSVHVLDLWRLILEAGQEFAIKACGLGARDSLRTGAGLPLAGQDIGHGPFVNNPWEFALPYQRDMQGFTKEFIGDQAIINSPRHSFTYPFAGFDLRKIDINAEPVVLDEKDHEIGRVLTCVSDMGIDRIDNEIVSINSPGLQKNKALRGLSCGFVLSAQPLQYDEKVFLKDKRRKIPVEIRKDIRPAKTARLNLKNFL